MTGLYCGAQHAWRGAWECQVFPVFLTGLYRGADSPDWQETVVTVFPVFLTGLYCGDAQGSGGRYASA